MQGSVFLVNIEFEAREMLAQRWQNKKLKKFAPKGEDIVVLDVNYASVAEWRST